MASKALTFKHIAGYSIRKLNRPLRKLSSDAKRLPEIEARFTRRRAKSIMLPKRKRPKTRYGVMKKRKTGKRIGTEYFEKGAYSKPGQPPYSDRTLNFNLRSIDIPRPISPSMAIPHARLQGGKAYAWRVGPNASSKRPKTGVYVPGLHEYGGTVRFRGIGRAGSTYEHRGLKLRHSNAKTVKYPKRPFMAPAAKEARESAARKSPYSLRKLVSLGGFKGKRKY